MPRPEQTDFEDILYFAKNNLLEKMKEWLEAQKTKLQGYEEWEYHEELVPRAAREAILAGHEEILRLLLAAGLSPNARVAKNDNRRFSTEPLIYFAVKTAKLNIVKLLVEYGATIYPDKIETDKKFASKGLRTAVEEGYTDIAIYLLERGSDANVFCDSGIGYESDSKMPLLTRAVKDGNTPIVESLVKHGAKITTALDFAHDKVYGKYAKYNTHIQGTFSDEIRINKIVDAFDDIIVKGFKFNYSLTPEGKAFFTKLNSLMQNAAELKNNATEIENISLMIAKHFSDNFSKYTYNLIEIKNKLIILLNLLEKFDQDRQELQLKADSAKESYTQIVMTCMLYAMGSNFTKDEKDFLKNLDVTGMNFIGVSIEGKPITKAGLQQETKSGAQNAIVTLFDLASVPNQDLKYRLESYLNTAFQRHGKLISEDGIVNLVPLIAAATVGDISAVKARVEAGRCEITEYNSALVEAAKNGHAEIVEVLFEAQADKFPIEKSKTAVLSAITAASQSHHEHIVKYLEERIDINQQDQWGNSLLYRAIVEGNLKRVIELIKKGADVNLPNYENETPLSIAALFLAAAIGAEPYAEIIKILLENNANPNNYKNISPLTSAVKFGHVEIVALLLPISEKKALIKEQSFSEDSMLQLPWYIDMMFEAVRKKNAVALLILLKHYGADFNFRNEYGNTLLCKAVANFPTSGDISYTVRQLLMSGYGAERAAPALQEKKKRLLEEAKQSFNQELQILEFLLVNGADPQRTNHDGKTPLALFIETKNLTFIENASERVMDLFMQYKADVNAVDNNGMTLLHEAAKADNIIALNYLINHGAFIDSQDKSGQTPLHIAASCGNKAAVQILLQSDANFTLTTKDGLTPLQQSMKAMEKDKKRYRFRSIEAEQEFEKPYKEAQNVIALFANAFNVSRTSECCVQLENLTLESYLIRVKTAKDLFKFYYIGNIKTLASLQSCPWTRRIGHYNALKLSFLNLNQLLLLNKSRDSNDLRLIDDNEFLSKSRPIADFPWVDLDFGISEIEISKKFLEKHQEIENKFQRAYNVLFNQLRQAAKNNDAYKIKQIMNSLTPAQFQKLLKDKNRDYSDCAIIHYAVKYNRPEAIEMLTRHLSYPERLEIFKLDYVTGCHSLHFAATINNLDDTNCSYEAAVAIKNLLFKPEDRSFWVALLLMQQEHLDTPVHYAARQQSPKLLKLFSEGVNNEEWEDILSIKNNSNFTVIEVYFINHLREINPDLSENEFLSAIRGPFNERAWVHFLIKNNVLNTLYKVMSSTELQICIQELTKGLSITSINRLMIAFEAKKAKLFWAIGVGESFFQANKTHPLAAHYFPNILKTITAFSEEEEQFEVKRLKIG